MNDDVVTFVQTLAAKYPDRFQRRAKQAKARVVTLLKLHMRPFPKRSGRPKDPRITEALRLKRQQEREIRAGGRRRPDWIAIARASAPGFERIKRNWHRRRAIERLQNAVKQREARERKRKDGTRARKGQYSARRPRE